MNANLQEGLSGVRVSQAFVREERNQEKFDDVAAGYRDARIRAQRLVAVYFPLVDFLSDIAAAIVLGAGSVMVANGTLDVASLIAFLLYLNLFFAPIQQLSQVFDSYQQARVAIAPHRRAARDADDRAAAGVAGDARAGCAARSCSTTCGSGTRTAIDDALRGVDLRIAAGETVALVGETGAGKSTVVKLVARFYDPTAGAVCVDGVPVQRVRPGRVPPASRRRAAGGVPVLGHDPRQHRVRAHGRDRRRGRGRGAGRRRARLHRDAARRVLAVGERARPLAVVGAAPADRAGPRAPRRPGDPAARRGDVEPRPADRGQGAGARWASPRDGRTTILIAHRLQTARFADRIVVIDHGRVVEDGTHDALLARGGRYARMWQLAAGEPAAAAN